MNKHAYYNAETQELAYYTHAEAMDLEAEVWERVPNMENMINDDGKHQIRLHFNDFTVDIVETDESYDSSEGSIISGTEVIKDVQPNAS